MECLALGSKKWAYFALFVLANEWLVLTSIRVHYIIDFLTSFVLIPVIHRYSEKLIFFFDVKIFGFKAEKRDLFYYKSCPKCGWNNEEARRLVSKEEMSKQLAVNKKTN